MSIYIAHTRGTSNALNTLILVEEKCLECTPECQCSQYGYGTDQFRCSMYFYLLISLLVTVACNSECLKIVSCYTLQFQLCAVDQRPWYAVQWTATQQQDGSKFYTRQNSLDPQLICLILYLFWYCASAFLARGTSLPLSYLYLVVLVLLRLMSCQWHKEWHFARITLAMPPRTSSAVQYCTVNL